MFLLEDRVLFDAAIAIDIADAANADDHADDFADNSDNSAEQNIEAFLQSPYDAEQSLPLPINPYIDAIVRDALDGNLTALGLDGNFALPAMDNSVQTQVLLISDSLDNADELYDAAGDNTIAIRYDATNTTTEQLLAQIEQALDGEQITRLGIAQQSNSNGKIDLLTNDSDRELWTGLNALMADDASIDLFASDMADSEFTDALETLTGHEVNYSDDLTGTNGDWMLKNGDIDLAQVYFDGEVVQNVNFSVISAEPTHELAIINSSVMDVDDILDDLGDNVDVLILDGNVDPLDQINDYLDAHDNIEYDAMHIISHGNDGYFVLNGRIVNGDYATANADAFAEIGEHLTADGDIMIYGCDLAANTEGQSLVAQLANLTGADIAASTDTTSNIGGNWNLEYTIGLVDSSSFSVEGYNYHLTDWSVTLATGSTDGTLRYAIDTHAVAGDTISFNVAGTDIVDIGTTDIDITQSMSINGYNNATTNNVTVQVTTPGTGGTAARVFDVNASGATVNISNMTIKGGDIYTSSGGIERYGGGIRLLAGTLSIDQVTITGSRGHTGGGIAVYADGTDANLNITSSTISDNKTDYGEGAGIYFWSDGISTTLNISDSIIENNINSSFGGGAIHHRITNGSMVMNITNSNINNNRGGFGGGLYSMSSLATTEIYISDTNISDNNTSHYGGAIYNYGSYINLSNCSINNNYSTSYGAIYNYAASATSTATLDIINCTINNNSANYVATIYNYAWYGTATTNISNTTISGNNSNYDGNIYNRAYAANSKAEINMTDSSISNNTVKYDNGGAFFNEAYNGDSHAIINLTNCTISGNIASHGGGIYNIAIYSDSNATATLINCTVCGNVSDYVGNGIYNYYQNTGANAVVSLLNSIVAYNYFDSYNGYSDIYSNGTISGDYNITGSYTLSGTNNTNYSYSSGIGAPLFASYETITANTVYNPILADNGGATMTVALSSNSIALAAGTATGAPFADQRGVPRLNPPSIGAYDVLSTQLYFRSSNDGIWSASENWEFSSDNVHWFDALITPNATNSLGIEINNEITVSGAITIDQTSIASNGNLTISAGHTVTIADGTGDDLSITGQLTLLGNNQLINNGTMTINSGSTIAYAGSSQNISAWNYYNLALNGSGTKTLTGDIQLSGDFLHYGGIFVHNSKSVTYNGNDQVIAAVGYSTLILSGTGSTKTFTDGTTSVEHEISISENMTLTGSSARSVTVQVIAPGSTNARVFNIAATGEINISNMNINGGNISSNSGGAIYVNSGTLSIDNVAISNSTAYNGGAIYNNGATINISNSTINANSVTYSGGGIYNNSGNITISNSTLANNSALSSSRDGGAIYLNSGTMQIINSTLSSNSAADDGGAIFSRGTLYVLNSSIIDNDASGSGNDIRRASGDIYLYYSRYADVTGVASKIHTETTAPNQISIYNNELVALADNGGSTNTMAVQSSYMTGNGTQIYHNSTNGYYFKATDGNYHRLTSYSSTITMNNNDLITTDQRGILRQATPTIGAYELPMQYRSQNSGNWSTAGNWQFFNGANWQTAIVAPNYSHDTITILHNINIAGNITADQVIINANATLTVIGGGMLTVNDGAGADLTVTSGEVINNGTIAFAINSEALYNGVNQNITGLNYYDLTLSGTGNKTLTGNIDVKNNFTVESNSHFIHNNHTVIYSGGDQDITAINYYNLTFSGSGNKNLTGDIGIAGVFTVNSGIFVHNNHSVIYNGTNQTITQLDYYGLTFDGSGDKTLTDNLNVYGTFTVNTGTLVHNNYSVNYFGNSENIAALTYYDLILHGNSYSWSNNASVINILTVKQNLTSSVSFIQGNSGNANNINQIVLDNAETNLIFIANATLSNFSNSSFNLGSGTVSYSGSDQMIAALDYNKLILTGSGSTKTFVDGITSIANEITLFEDITLTGSSQNNVTVQVTTPGINGTTSRVFNVDAINKTVNISNISIKGGNVYFSSDIERYGGSILLQAGTLNIDNVNISGSKARYGGGIAVYANNTTAQLNIDNSSIDSSNAYNGGGIYSYSYSAGNINIKLNNTTLSNNNATYYGGGIYNRAYLSNSSAVIELTNSTISENNATHYGGGIYNYTSSDTATVILINSTISGNQSTYSGAGIYNYSASSTNITNSIVAYNYDSDNTGYLDIYNSGTISGDYNIIGGIKVGANSTNYSYIDGMGDSLFNSYGTVLANTIYKPILADNGGGTHTIALASNSIAATAGTENGAPTTDQRGYLRLLAIDTGAYQINRFEIGDFLTTNNGAWSETANWNYYDGTNWLAATVTPDSTVNNIYIRHAINLDTTISIDQTVIISTGQLTVNSSQTLTIADGSGNDLIVNNTMTISGAIVINSGATVDLLTGNSTVNYNGGSQNILALNYHTLQLNGSGTTKTFANGTTAVANEILLSDSMTLTGSSRNNVTLQVSTPGTGGIASRVFNINAPASTVNISNMTIQGGDISGLSGTAGYGGAILLQAGTLNLSNTAIIGSSAYHGGAIALYSNNAANPASMTITDSLLNSNIATNNGGAIYSELSGTNNIATIALTSVTMSNNGAYNGGGIYGSATIDCSLNISATDSVIDHNSAGYQGGAINLNSSGNGTVALSLTQTTVDSNIAISGGGINSNGNNSMTFTASTISNNNASYGGGIRQSTTNNGTATINLINSTVSANRAISGGGIYQSTGNSGNQVAIYLTNTTLSDNSAADAGGIYSEAYSAGIAAVYARNTIIAGNSGDTNFYSDGTTIIVDATEHWGTYNIIGTQTTLNSGQIFDTVNNNVLNISDPGLYMMADYGGSTATMLPLSSGTAATFTGVDLSTIITTDQRGEMRTGTWRAGSVQRIAGDSNYDSVINNTNWTVVTTANDLIDLNDNVVSLREAISFATAGSTITFAGDYSIGIDHRLPFINHNLTIDGTGHNITITGDSDNDGSSDTITGIFSITTGTVTIDTLTITKGYSDYGGAIYNIADLKVNNSQLTANKATYSGGAIFNAANTAGASAILTIDNSTISNNQANSTGNNNGCYGGGIYNNGSFGGTATVNITNSTITNNHAYYAGGIANISDHATGNANLTVTNSTISNNSAAYGGAVYNNAGDIIDNAVINYATANFIDCTITGNSATFGGLYNRTVNAGVSVVNLTNTVVTYNSNNSHSSYSDITNSGGTISGSYNILGNYNLTGTTNTNYSYTNGMGASLFATYDTVLLDTIYRPVIADNGGNTMTIALASDSIALATGTATGTPLFDQRGYLRMDGVDIGSYQLNGILVQNGSYITINDGDWSTTAIWNVYDGTDFIAATAAPDSTVDNIYVQHNVAVTANLTIDQTIVTLAGHLTVNSGQTLTIADGAGTDLTVKNSMTITGALMMTSGATTDLLTDSSTVTYNGGSQTIAALAYSTLALSGSNSTKIFANGITSVAHEIVLSETMTLTGSSRDNVTVQVTDPGVTTSRVFNINNSLNFIDVSISNMTIKGGDISGLLNDDAKGGAIFMGRDGTLTLDTVTVSDAKAIDGGGIYSHYIPTININNSIISNNEATQHGGGIHTTGNTNITNSTISSNIAFQGGGGVYNDIIELGKLHISNSTFNDNTANRGGAICAYDESIITDTNIINNHTSEYGYGAGIYTYSRSITTITNSIISDNDAGRGGGFAAFSGTASINNTIINNNIGNQSGGGIYNYYGTITVADSIISNNYSVTGGGVYNAHGPSNITFTRTNIIDNSANRDGAGIISSGALKLDSSTVSGNIITGTVSGAAGITTGGWARTTIINSTISNNSGVTTGGIRSTSQLSLINSTVSGNSASAVDGIGGLHLSTQSTNYLLNSIVLNNSATTAGNEDIVNDASTVTAYYSRFDSNKTTGTITPDASNVNAPYNNELGALADNGGGTQTMALLPGALMLNTGTMVYQGIKSIYFLGSDSNYHMLTDYSVTVSPNQDELISTDQRGVTRGSSPDIGAYEYITGYWRTIGNSVWSTGSNWELLNNSNSTWTTMTIAPTAENANHIEVAHQINITASCNVDQLNISGHGELTVDAGGTLTVEDGDGDDLMIDGSLIVNGILNNAGTVVNNGTISIATDSHFNYTGTDQTILALNYGYLGLSGTGSTKTFETATTSVAHEIILTDANMTITGRSPIDPWAASTVLQVTTPGSGAGATAARVFHSNVGVGNSLTINDMIIKGGDISGQTGDAANGGSIYHESGTLNINNATITGSKAANGGAIYSTDILNLTGSTISSSHATNNGGGIYNNTAALNLSNTTVDSNIAARSGGGISSYQDVTTTIEESTISNNQGRYAGILSFDSTLVLVNSTISGNSSSSIVGGVGSLNGTISILDTTISNNTARVAFGAVYNNRSQLYLVNSIVINNPLSGGGADNAIKTGTTGGDSFAFYSWYDATKISGSLTTNVNAPNLTSPSDGTLSPLADNGGSTWTMAVQSGSNIIGAGTFIYHNFIDGYYFADQDGSGYHELNYDSLSPFLPGGKISTDQRGETRGGSTPNPYIPTMGAYEVNTTMVDDLPNGDEWSSDEFSDLIKVHKATQNELDSALMEFIA